MTAHFDLHNSSTTVPTTVKPAGRRRWLPIAPIGLVAASAFTVGAFAALPDETNVERVGSRSTAEVVTGASRPSIESSIVSAERRWAGDEFDVASAADLCMTQTPC